MNTLYINTNCTKPYSYHQININCGLDTTAIAWALLFEHSNLLMDKITTSFENSVGVLLESVKALLPLNQKVVGSNSPQGLG